MKARWFPRSIFLLMSGPALAQSRLSQPPSPAVLDDLARQVLASGKAPGFCLAVQWQGKPYFVGSYGLENAETHSPTSAQTRYAIGSISKQFAAVSILQLAEQGRLSLDDKLIKYFPAVPQADRITLRMLLNQTSGLHNYPRTSEHDWPVHGVIPTARLEAILATDPADFPPGTRFGYSNTN